MRIRLALLVLSVLLGLIVLSEGTFSSRTQARGATPSATARPVTTATTTPRSSATATPTYVTPTAAATATPADRYFPETGYTVPAAFMSYWAQYGGLPIFGFPITDAHMEKSATDGSQYLVQYFERNRFEYHPEFGGTPNQVLLGLLGAELTRGRVFPTVEPFADTTGRVYLDPTKHSLGEPFLSYWQSRGGLGVFGYPISEPEEEVNQSDGKTYLVQYFQRNRFEFHPENQPPYDVLLGLLGRDYMDVLDAKNAWGTPIPGGLPPVDRYGTL